MPDQYEYQTDEVPPSNLSAIMRILVTGKHVTAAHRQIVWMLRAGCTVLFVGTTDPYEGRSRENYDFVHVTIDSHATETESIKALKDAISSAVRRFQPDIIHAQGLGVEAMACVEAGYHPLVLSAQGYLNDLAGDFNAPLSRGVEALVRSVDALIVNSPAVAIGAERRFDAGPKVVSITQGVDTRRFRPAQESQRRQWRQNLAVPNDAFLMISPRGWADLYNHDLIVRAWAMARSRFDRPSVLAFTRMGRNSRPGNAVQCFAQVMAEIESLGVRKDIRILPCMPQVLMPGLYGAADAMISYPNTDAFASTLFEALACECPVISARLPGNAGSFLETACQMVAPRDPEALAEAMIELVSQPVTVRSAKARAVREWLVENYDEERAVNELLKVYYEICLVTPFFYLTLHKQ